ncbi:PREDICTED: probable RNA-binding protein CG14230 [Papilio polytes]|uniref:probable RNA-binding protein CG14230 n=1 Tax=Papilio polytes TaxID=76194 RepID=UPI0006764808|nr:PREDICTED: probable RNA-binding protein CG14230 [Papilio polytes]
MSFHTRLFVGNIPKSLSENDLREAFTSYGEIINLDIKQKPGAENDEKRFAFLTLSASNYEVESCIKKIADVDFNGQRLYVTRARESFLERLQREREQASKKEEKKETVSHTNKENPTINLGTRLNPPKRKIDETWTNDNQLYKNPKAFKNNKSTDFQSNNINENIGDDKKLSSDQKRLESLKRKRQEFKEKKNIIKTGLVGIDKVPNKKVIFSDDEDGNIDKNTSTYQDNINNKPKNGKNILFDDEESDSEVTFEIKKQFEGKKGQKILDLQSRYKSDKRFTLDERFIDDQSDDENNEEKATTGDDRVDVGQVDEKSKQLNILQDVLGVTIKTHNSEHLQKTKPKLGMLRYDPMHPEHAKFLAPATTQEVPKKAKKAKKSKEIPVEPPLAPTVVENVEVSKEQFYSVSDTLKEALVQPTKFSLRDLFGNKENDKEVVEESADYIPLNLPKEKEKKSRNPLDTGERNPFVYDSSDSEDEGQDKQKEIQVPEEKQVKAVWRENLFFSKDDSRLREGLLFFNKFEESEVKKERRGLKTVMKKRIYNKERKNQMFQKKIGGRQKSMKKDIRKRR